MQSKNLAAKNCEMMRVREAISSLNYDALVRRKIIPDIIKDFTVTTKRYSPFVYKTKNFAFFGMLMDYWVRTGFRNINQYKIDLGVEPVTDSSILNDIELYRSTTVVSKSCLAVLRIVRILLNCTGFQEEDIKTYIPTLNNLCKELNDVMLSYIKILGSELIYNTEFNFKTLSGHPDVITPTTILDIKTTSAFKTIGKESCLQILAYYALAKSTGKSIKNIGLILPMQRDVQVIRISDWNSREYMDMLLEISNPKPTNLTMMPDLMSIFPIGNHVCKGSLFDNHKSKESRPHMVDTLISWGKMFNKHGALPFPIQMFLRSPRGDLRKGYKETNINEINSAITKYKISYFTHAPYVINLCADAKDDNGKSWAREVLKDDIKRTVSIGGKGVVVHTGATVGRNKEEALKTMETMVRDALNEATEKCKLLLETPCGEGTEVCTTIEEMHEFVLRFSEKERKKLGLCVDTAHIHAAGYKPIQYLLQWEELGLIDIVLVHYNDSKVCCGSCVDRHEIPGMGHIGYEEMFNVAVWCKSKNVPMVFE
jgi:deoxyribonuclease-4